LAVLYVAAGFAIHATRVLPTWLAWVSWLLGLLSISFFLGFIGLMAMAPWVLTISIIVASRRTELDLTEAAAPATPARTAPAPA
jgi:hypothetical protein